MKKAASPHRVFWKYHAPYTSVYSVCCLHSKTHHLMSYCEAPTQLRKTYFINEEGPCLMLAEEGTFQFAADAWV